MKLLCCKNEKIRYSTCSDLGMCMKNSGVVSQKFKTNRPAFDTERSFSIEILLPNNASYYAALSANYLPKSHEKNLLIKVGYLRGVRENYYQTIADQKATIYKGLSYEYVDAVLAEACTNLSDEKKPSGQFFFDSAACCEVGSSPRIFRQAARIIMEVLLSEKYPNDMEIEKIILQNI